MFNQIRKEAVWTAHQLYSDHLAGGSSGNISFRLEDKIFISKSGTIFGRITEEDFIPINMNGTVLGDGIPSKEYPLHLALYRCQPETAAVIHTHSFYTTLWSCLRGSAASEGFPHYTPYLSMQFRNIIRIPYAPPGSSELFSAFSQRTRPSADGYLLENHGAVVSGSTLLKAYSKIHELETSAKLAWFLQNTSAVSLD